MRIARVKGDEEAVAAACAALTRRAKQEHSGTVESSSHPRGEIRRGFFHVAASAPANPETAATLPRVDPATVGVLRHVKAPLRQPLPKPNERRFASDEIPA
jgi:hypothetical protein